MSDILKQIQALQEQFSNLFEAEKEDLKTYQNKAAKDIMDKLGLDIKGYIKRITPVRDYKELEQHKQRKVKEFAADQLSPYEKVKGIKLEDKEHPLDKHKDTIKAHKKEIQDTAKEYKTGDDSVAKSIIKGKNKMNDNNSYNELISQIMDLKEAFSNLFEVEGLGDPSADVPPSDNKIKRRVKTKNGKAELVSVEDELFPYEGDKKDQYRQKIIDTINGMIQGTSTLQDLLQIVRQKKAPLKEAMKLMEAVKVLLEGKEEDLGRLNRDYNKEAEGLPNGSKEMYNVNKKYRKLIRKVNKHYAKTEPLKEAMELMEELLLERNKENRQKKENWELKTNKITKKEKKAIQDYAKQEGDEAKFHREVAADYDHIYSQQPAKAPDGTPNSVAAYFNDKYQEMLRNKGRNEQNIADEVEPLTKKLKNRKHSFHDRVRGWTESEALEEAISALLEYTEADKKKAAKKVLKDRKREYLDKHKEYKEMDSIGVADLETMYNDAVAKERYDHAKKLANEALEEALQILEGLFIKDGRGDLIDDILKATTGKTLSDHVVSKIKAVLGAGKVKNTEGKVKNAKGKVKK